MWHDVHKQESFWIVKHGSHNSSCSRRRFEFLLLWWVCMMPFHWLPLRLRFKIMQPSFVSRHYSCKKNNHHSHTVSKIHCSLFSVFFVSMRQHPRDPPGTNLLYWRAQFHQIICLPTDNCTMIDSVISIHLFQALVNVCHLLVITPQEFITARCFWRTSSALAIVMECYGSATHEIRLNYIWIQAGRMLLWSP